MDVAWRADMNEGNIIASGLGFMLMNLVITSWVSMMVNSL